MSLAKALKDIGALRHLLPISTLVAQHVIDHDARLNELRAVCHDDDHFQRMLTLLERGFGLRCVTKLVI